MNHPRPDEWVPYLYGESQHEVRHELKAHLESCPECRAHVEEMQGSRNRLDAWQLPRSKNPNAVFKGRFAMAAVLLLLCGFGFGYASRDGSMEAAERRIEQRVQTKLAAEFKSLIEARVSQASLLVAENLTQESARLLASRMSDLESQRAQDLRAVQAALRKLEAQRISDLAVLKRELDTLAFNTDAGLRHTVAGLFELANHTTVSTEENKRTQ